MKENIEEDIKMLENIDVKFFLTGMVEQNDYVVGKADEVNNAIEHILSEYKRVLKENEELKEYKRISELTKISCCTAQNCGALSNAIKDSLENEKLKKENEELKGQIEKLLQE